MKNKVNQSSVLLGNRIRVRGREYQVKDVTMPVGHKNGYRTRTMNVVTTNEVGETVIFDFDELVRVNAEIL